MVSRPWCQARWRDSSSYSNDKPPGSGPSKVYGTPPKVKRVMARAKAAIVDLHDTLVFLRPNPDQYLGRLLGITAAECRRAWSVVDRQLDAAMATAGMATWSWTELFNLFLLQLSGRDAVADLEAIMKAYYSDPSNYRLYPDTRPFLQEVAEMGIDVVVVSNSSARLETVLTGLGVYDLVRRAVPARALGRDKRSAEFFRFAAADVGAAPDACFAIGDSWTEDVESSYAAGMHPILLARTGCCPEVAERAAQLGVPVIQTLRSATQLLRVAALGA
jgi:FMN phosphatase YigB (HAD superfamily)